MSCVKCEQWKGYRAHRLAEVFGYSFPNRGVKLWWSIDLAKLVILERRLKAESLNVQSVAEFLTTRVDIEFAHLEHVDMSEPAIVLLLHDGAIVLDGNHRLARALQQGMPDFPVYFLEEHMLEPIKVDRLSA